MGKNDYLGGYDLLFTLCFKLSLFFNEHYQ